MFMNETCPKYYDCLGLGPNPSCYGCRDEHTDFYAKAAENICKAVEEVTEGKVGSTIKDSGDRTQFASGAVRDMHGNKGRFDIMPLEVVAEFLSNDAVITSISTYMTTEDISYLYYALESFTRKAFNDSKETMLLEVAKHFEDGAKKYGEANYRLGIPANCYIDSAVRHYVKWLRGDIDERHDRAVCWNLLALIWEIDWHKYNKKGARE